MRTRINAKYQTTIPKEVRNFLNIKSGKEVEWHLVKGVVVIDSKNKIKHPVKFLTSQIKNFNVDAVKLVRNARADFT